MTGLENENMKLRDECAALAQERDALHEKVVRYEKWFADNATNLATHRIGGYFFDSDLRGKRPYDEQISQPEEP
jgi:hypothetical protein